MRAALISMAAQPRDPAGTAPLALAGKTLARRQLEFALATGCESVIVLGDGASAEAIALRHAAEAAGAKFQAIRDGHGLLGAVRADDELLALAPGLLPEAPAALEALGKGRAVLVVPAGPGVAAGFERIDLERAWAGALVVSGAQVERLSDLPADIEPASALVRVALQARIKEKRLPEGALADGSWVMVTDARDLPASQTRWLERHSPPVWPLAPSKWLAHMGLRPLASRLLAARRSVDALVLGTVVVLAASVLAAWYDLAPLGFALVPLAAVLAQTAVAMKDLRDAPFGLGACGVSLPAFLPWLVDGTILAGAVLAIEGNWLYRLFLPLVLLGTLHAIRLASRSDWAAIPGDRSLLAAILAIAAGLGVVEPVVMLLSLASIVLNLAQSRAKSG